MGEFSITIVRTVTLVLSVNHGHWKAHNRLGGKCLGGSSITNGLYYGRGSASVYDHWARLGNPGWSWDDVYPLFIKVLNPSGVLESDR